MRTINLSIKVLIVLIISICCCRQVGYGQANIRNWVFGTGFGMQFSGTSVPTSFGSATAICTSEGCAVISDCQGNLAFYTDGVSVWDKNGNYLNLYNFSTGAPSFMMNTVPNGISGTASTVSYAQWVLRGHPSSTQTGVVVPIPGTTDKYYIFTTYALDQSPRLPPWGYQGMYYSIVDMSLNGGLGGMDPNHMNQPMPGLLDGTINAMTANTIVTNNTIGEKITACRGVSPSPNEDYWVITHVLGGGNNQANPTNTQPQVTDSSFLAFHITSGGTYGTISFPVVSNVGIGYAGTGGCTGTCWIDDARGQLKVSPSGSLVADALYGGVCPSTVSTPSTQTGNNTQFQLLHFDNDAASPTGGELFNSTLINTSYAYTTSVGNDINPYGIDFSPSENYIYMTTLYNGSSTAAEGRLYMAPVSNLTNITLLYSDNRNTSGFNLGGLQLGPDGRIYIAMDQHNFVSSIENPNTSGASYYDDRVTLVNDLCSPFAGSPNYHNIGLPSFIASDLVNQYAATCCTKPSAYTSADDTTICAGSSLTFTGWGSSYGEWFEDGNSLTGGIEQVTFPTTSVTVTFGISDTGVHTFCFIAYTDNSGYACSDTVCRTITIVNCCTLPTNSFTINGDSLNNDTICNGTPIILVATTTGEYIQYYLSNGDTTQSSGIEYVTGGTHLDTLPSILATPGTYTLCLIAFSSNPDSPGYVPCSDTFCRTFTIINCCSATIHAHISAASDTVCINSVISLTISGGPYGEFLPNGINNFWGITTGIVFSTGDTPNLFFIVPDTFTAPGVYTICYVAYSANPDSTPYLCTDTQCVTINIQNCPCTPPTGNYIGITTATGDTTSTVCEGTVYYLHLNSNGVWGTFLVDGGTNNGIDSFLFVGVSSGGVSIGPIDTPLSTGAHQLCLISHSTFPDGELPDCPDTLCITVTISNCDCEITKGTSFIIANHNNGNYEFYDSFTTIQPNYINWIVDDSVVAQMVATDTFSYPFGPGYHIVCMQTATVLTDSAGNNFCCYNTICDSSIYIDACTIWKSSATITYTLDSNNVDSVTFTFHGSTNPLSPTIVWNFGDGTSLVSSDLTVTHVFHVQDTVAAPSPTAPAPDSNNIFSVCAYVIWSKGDSLPFDSTGVCCCIDTICTEVWVSPCALPTFNIAIDEEPAPGVYIFGIVHSISYTYTGLIDWTSSDGTHLFGSYTFLDSIPYTGSYEICARIPYRISYIDSTYDCPAAHICIDTTLTGTLRLGARFNLYPNPTTGYVTVQIVNNSDATTANLDISDMAGDKILTKSYTGLGKGATQNFLDISTLPQGIYTIKMTLGDIQQVDKLVKE